MKCPECVTQDLRSTVTSGGGTTTLAYSPPFWDEDGRYHSHDSNTSTYFYSCPNAHEWSEQSTPPQCWCQVSPVEGEPRA